MATLSLVPQTELAAVNIMLEVVGEQPVSAISSSVPESEVAQSILHATSREIQGAGLSFNTDKKYLMSLDDDDKCPVATNILHIDGTYRSDQYVQRGLFLYDRYNQSLTFDSAPYCDVVWFLPWTDLPSYARELITIVAARRYQKRVLGSDTLDGFTQEDEARARALFVRMELDTEDNNILQGPAQSRIWLNRR